MEWSAGSRLLLRLFRLIGRQREIARLRALRRRGLREDKRDVESAGQYREHLQQRLLGHCRRQQQPVAGPAANGQADSHREILKRECDRGGLPDCDSLPLLRLTNIRVAGSHVCVFSSAWMRYF